MQLNKEIRAIYSLPDITSITLLLLLSLYLHTLLDFNGAPQTFCILKLYVSNVLLAMFTLKQHPIDGQIVAVDFTKAQLLLKATFEFTSFLNYIKTEKKTSTTSFNESRCQNSKLNSLLCENFKCYCNLQIGCIIWHFLEL